MRWMNDADFNLRDGAQKSGDEGCVCGGGVSGSEAAGEGGNGLETSQFPTR